jgi:hypothetical protein
VDFGGIAVEIVEGDRSFSNFARRLCGALGQWLSRLVARFQGEHREDDDRDQEQNPFRPSATHARQLVFHWERRAFQRNR